MPGQTSLEQSLNTRLLSFSFADYISFTAVNSFQWILSNLAPEKDCSNSNFSMVHWGWNIAAHHYFRITQKLTTQPTIISYVFVWDMISSAIYSDSKDLAQKALYRVDSFVNAKKDAFASTTNKS